ncbi:hypothetical protein GCM10010201_08590 [Pilimelia columellifera subsp. columellifera]|uniref:Uncharacterized protein n=1 Tax=Pilimelia columellifera subsp. columellifera TaxID=706583 RepID=A0ABP6AFZ2_9ACTN
MIRYNSAHEPETITSLNGAVIRLCLEGISPSVALLEEDPELLGGFPGPGRSWRSVLSDVSRAGEGCD